MSRFLVFMALITVAISSLNAAEGALNPKDLQTFRPYQLALCLVSDEAIGSEDMGEGISFVHKGQEITLCCKSCLKKFAKKPGVYMKKMKALEAKAGAGKKAKGDHGDHDHGAHKH